MDGRDEDEEVIAYAITNLFEELEYQGHLSRRVVDKYYHLFGNHCGLVSLLPRPMQPMQQRSLEMMGTPKSNYDWLVLFRKKDQYVDEDYLKLVQQKYPSATGFAFADGSGTVAYNVVPDTVPLEGDEGLVNTQTVMNYNSVMCFGNASSIPDADLQPFTLLEVDSKNDNGEAVTLPILMAFLTSTSWPEEYVKDGSTHSPAYHVVEEYLKEKVAAIYEDNDKSLARTMQALNKPLVMKEILRTVGKNGCVHLIGGDGSFVPITNINTWTEYVWGTTTDNLGYKPVEPKADKEKDAKAGRGIMFTLKGATSHTPPKKEEAKTSVPITKAVSESRITVASNGERDVLMPDQIFSKGPEPKKSWIIRHFDFGKDKHGKPVLPADWETMKGFPYKNLRANSPLRDKLKTLEALGPAIADAVKQVTTEALPIIPQAERDLVAKLLAKYMANSDKLWESEKISSIETQSPSYSEQTGHPMAAACRAPQELYWQLISHHPRAAYALMFSMRNLINEFIPDAIQDALEEAKVEEKDSGGTEKKLAHAM